LKVTYTEEAVADIVEALTYLNERSPTAAAKLDADIARCIERLADREFDGLSPGFVRVLSQTATESQQTKPRSRRSWRSPTTSRHSHTVCFCRARRLSVSY
jgi:plasmid stabilization system protein ParE